MGTILTKVLPFNCDRVDQDYMNQFNVLRKSIFIDRLAWS